MLRVRGRTGGADDRGMVTVWAVIVTVACMSMAGLVLDGGALLRARSESFDLAGSAARAGAQELEQIALTEGHVLVDEPAAREAVTSYLSVREAQGDVVVHAQSVTVTVHRTVRFQILRPASIAVAETATARAHPGRP